MAKKGLGKGLDSLIPDYYDEKFDSNSTQSLEDMLNDDVQVEEIEDDVDSNVEDDNIQDDIDESGEVENQQEVLDNEIQEDDEELAIEDDITPQVQENVEEVIEIVDKNPRITLWSSRSAAVFRYLRKTEPEFSISKEASTLIDEAVSKKYPEIWELFKEI